MRDQIGEDGLLQAEDMAEAILYALTQPERVSVNEMLVRPTRQTR
jgi:NADP-dependent 3-hydroxy acid dehydrogenase YdfG